MRYYIVLIEADGLAIPMAYANASGLISAFVNIDEQNRTARDAVGAITGFWATRRVKASSIEAAREVAIQLILDEWKSGRYAKLNARPTRVRVESVQQLGFLRAAFSKKPAGCAFY